MRTLGFSSCSPLSAVQDTPDLVKASCRVAMVLEEQFITAGWPTGELFGSEEALAQRFDVGVRIIDEAVRVLTMRGTARLRRTSSNFIELEITAPEPGEVYDVLSGYAYLSGVNAQHRDGAVAYLEAVRRRVAASTQQETAAESLAFLSRFVDSHLEPGAPPKGVVRERFRKFRAGQIANRILERYFGPSFEPGRKVGSEAELSALYRADRSITRQAIRLLESAGLVTTLSGRGNGIFTKRPPSAPVSRLVCCYFSSCGLPIAAAFELLRSMSIEAVLLAAGMACAAELQAFERTFAQNWGEQRSMQLTDIFSTEDCRFSAVHNPLIELFLRTLRGYVVLTGENGGGNSSSDMASCFIDYTRRELEGRSNPAFARSLYAS